MLGPLALAVALPLLPAANALVRKNDVGRLPALGWNSWNAFGCDINSTKVITAANEVINLGLKDLGYEYINIDDCWSIKNTRDKSTNRLIPDPSKFPDGISGVAEQVHDLGLKVRIYSSASEVTCAGYPVSLGYETVDAQSFAEWGIDYLKYDSCDVSSNWTDTYAYCVPDSDGDHPNGTCPDITNPAPEGYDWKTSKTYSGLADVKTWGNETANSWRMSGDITADWARIAQIANENSFLMDYANFWSYPDPDMLEIGNGDLTIKENRAHFILWAAMKSPLIIGTALDSIKDDHVAILKNKYLLDFNQDPVIGSPAHPSEYWSGASSKLEGTLVLMLNSEDATSTRTARWSEIPELKSHNAYQVIDAWTGKDLGCVKNTYKASLKSHDAAVLVVKGRY
ncbi:hypothetical protein N7536_007598 [Penicillium majusculum]|uniref:Alpha-galactosidase n=1 Tax=Penicillium solitum TaxID=60172 RepID=A0A1V6QWD6_9EURO|nr:uncharacterized protein PENSOL_c032G11268 [Penicillium solitum]KAJ5684979.1 hypothetical protein N7536_007598 [Penicillium majusculum]OQD93513.1 hypothetical protein PENSOL_c032G11268 [Penicillium solitum]